MKKKIIIIALALAAALAAVIGAAASCHGGAVSGSLKLDKDSYGPNEKITVSVAGITEKMANDKAFVAIYAKDAVCNAWGESQRPAAGSGVLDFTSPAEAGNYEMRLYRTGSFDGGRPTFVASVPFVVNQSAAAGSITLDAASYAAGSAITVKYSGITGRMAANGAFAAIYAKGAGHYAGGARYALPQGDGAITLAAPKEAGEYEVRLYGANLLSADESPVMTVPFSVTPPKTEMQRAAEMGLVPDTLKNADLSKNISRAEFAAVAVKVYENIAGKKAATWGNPFTDTTDMEVLKVYNIGLMAGISQREFAPDATLDREQCATVMTRALKQAYIPGWTISADGGYTLVYPPIGKFADDHRISDWAKPSVYFMASNGVIPALGGKVYLPWGKVTREQAIVVGLRVVEKFAGKGLEYK
ncbi:MAG: S-layer homology domain-containing protein [Firmicutes bacterium]|nr:S-layer homology domain-containing protein [Bacillota bacterium]